MEIALLLITRIGMGGWTLVEGGQEEVLCAKGLV